LNNDIQDHNQFVNEEISKDLKINFWNCELFKFIEVSMENTDDITRNIEKIKKYLN